jgi:hypothetical protein
MREWALVCAGRPLNKQGASDGCKNMCRRFPEAGALEWAISGRCDGRFGRMVDEKAMKLEVCWEGNERGCL